MKVSNVESLPVVLPIGKDMCELLKHEEYKYIEFRRSKGIKIFDGEFLDDYTISLSRGMYLNYLWYKYVPEELEQIIAIDTRLKTIIGITGSTRSYVWFPYVNEEYNHLHLREILLTLILHDNKDCIFLHVPEEDCTDDCKLILNAYASDAVNTHYEEVCNEIRTFKGTGYCKGKLDVTLYFLCHPSHKHSFELFKWLMNTIQNIFKDYRYELNRKE